MAAGGSFMSQASSSAKQAKQKVKSSNYANDEIMEYFQKQIASFSPNNEKEVSITNQFGFVE